MTFVLLAIAAYLLGAIPFGLLIGLAHGKDVRKLGSGNIGATNVGRVVGRTWGRICLALDILKGLIPTVLGGVLTPYPPDAAALFGWLAVGLAAVLGHTFPVYLGFRGGKGVATTIGVALGIFPYYTIPLIASLIAFGLVRLFTGYVSLGSLTLAAAFPLAFMVYVLASPQLSMAQFWPLQVAAAVLGLLIIVRHAGNIARLVRGEELGRAPQPDGAGATQPGSRSASTPGPKRAARRGAPGT